MAIAPVNKFLSVAVPVHPGEQLLYEVPTGTSAILLYAQVSNVGIGTTYPTISFIHRRESRSTGNKRDIRIIKDVEIPPNDAVILIDGRLILEKTALTLDRLFIRGSQTGVTTISNVAYDEPSGVATVTTMGVHGFSPNDQITMAGIAFTCPSGTGITTTIFPDPQQSYVVDQIVDSVGTSKTYTAFLGNAKGYPHTYQPAIHTFKRAKPGAVTANTGVVFSPVSGTTYNPKTGDLVMQIPNHGLVAASTQHTITGAVYDARVGIMTCTLNGHGFAVGNLVKFDDNALTFKCSMDGNNTNHTYPRSTDPASNSWRQILAKDTNTFSINVGASPIIGHSVSDATYTPANGNLVLTIGNHSLSVGQRVKIAKESLVFTCAQDGNSAQKKYPRSNGNDPTYNTAVAITAVTSNTITLNALQGTSPSNTSAHIFKNANNTYTPSAVAYNPNTGIMTFTVNGHGFVNGEQIKIADNSLTFTCAQDSNASNHTYPRTTDYASGRWLPVSNVTTNTFTMKILDTVPSTNTSAHTFVSAVSGCLTRAVISSGGDYTHAWQSAVTNGMRRAAGSTVTIADESLIFTCTMDNNGSEHAYPRSTDPASGTALIPSATTTNSITVNVGMTTAGGQVAPLQLEFIGSVLENSSA